MLIMALSSLLDPHETEQYKYRVLLDHLKVDLAKRLVLAYLHTPQLHTQAIRALDEHYEQPRQLALKELHAILDMPVLCPGDGQALDRFPLHVQALVGLEGLLPWAMMVFLSSPVALV